MIRMIISLLVKDEKDVITQEAADATDIIRQGASANAKDILNQLSVDILVSILTCMPTKEAVRTSILSKRWRNLYKYACHIDFSSDEFLHPENERFFRLHHHIRSFHFRCHVAEQYTKQFERCISSLGRFGLEELVVYCSSCRNFPSCRKFSCCRRYSDLSFSCDLLSELPSLKYFRLALCSMQPTLKVQFSSLQILNLIDVIIRPGALECILSNCLSLHLVTVDCCDCPSILCFCGPDLRLKSLIMQDCEGVKQLELHASNLTRFEFHNRMPKDVKFIFDLVPQLQSIHLDSDDLSIMSSVFMMLAQDSFHPRSLAFPVRDNFYNEYKAHIGVGTRKFNNIRRLELKFYCTPETNLLTLIPFLESCCFLQEFHLSELHLSEFHLDIPYNLNYDWCGSQVQARKHMTFHSELKKVKISGFSGTQNEVEFVLFMLRSTVNLEQMCIIWRFNSYYDYSDMRRRIPQGQMIEKQLQKQALCKTAQVILKYALD